MKKNTTQMNADKKEWMFAGASKDIGNCFKVRVFKYSILQRLLT